MVMRGHERRAHEIQQARRQLANLVNSGQVSLVDRMGTPIQVGDMVMMNLPNQPLGRVVEVKPVVDPNQPPGLVAMVVQFVVPIQARGQVPMQNIVIVSRPEPTENTDGQTADGDKTETPDPGQQGPSKIIVAD